MLLTWLRSHARFGFPHIPSPCITRVQHVASPSWQERTVVLENAGCRIQGFGFRESESTHPLKPPRTCKSSHDPVLVAPEMSDVHNPPLPLYPRRVLFYT